MHWNGADDTPAGLVITIGPGSWAQNLPFAMNVVVFEPVREPFTFFGSTPPTSNVESTFAFIAVTVRMNAPPLFRVTLHAVIVAPVTGEGGGAAHLNVT